MAPPKLDLQVRLTSFTQEMQRRGMEPGVVMLQAETVASDETVAEALELEAGAEVHHLRRLLTANAIPMAIEENWIPAALLPNLLRTSPNFSVYAELTSADLAPQWGEDMIEAHAATAQEAALLSVPEAPRPWISPGEPSTSTAPSTTRAPCSAPTATPCGSRWPPPNPPFARTARRLEGLTQVGTGQPPGGLYHGVLVWTISPVPAKVPHLTAPAHVLTPHLGTITH